MSYDETDVAYLVASGPYVTLAGKDWRRFLRRQIQQGKLYSDALAAYPQTKCEPLDFHYVCLFSLGALDDQLFEDLLTKVTWRGMVWAAWLAALKPSARYHQPLIGVRPKVHENNKTVVDVALAIIEGSQPTHLAEHIALTKEFSNQISSLPLPIVPLRRARTDRAAFLAMHEITKSIYRNEGTDAAFRYIRKSASYEYNLSYPAWRKFVAKQVQHDS